LHDRVKKRRILSATKMKHTLTLLALCTLVAHASSGAVRGVPSDRIGGDLKGSHPGYMRVWVEKGARKVNVDNTGVPIKVRPTTLAPPRTWLLSRRILQNMSRSMAAIAPME
jgi:hypothetical protein